MDAKELKIKMVACVNMAINKWQRHYLYYDNGEFIITKKYMGKHYLFYAYPGGRKVMSEECARVLNS